jgi:SIR2-like domain
VIDPLITLAFSLQANPGAYALLLGSGVSRAAGIPTGWEVVKDLIERVARLQGDETGGDPAAWFNERYGGEPTYSVLLAELAAEPAERNRLLRAYFEPTEEERDQGLKVPTGAHHAIARLVQAGYVRVIVTTNFDRLVELALADAGVVPTTLATPDAVEGALPLAHTNCTIVKVHGDYVDARIRNTPEELAHYDERIDRLLDRIFDEYGLVICGWSAEWDIALRDAISRAPTRRFTTYWATRGELRPEARALLESRRGVEVRIADADAFFVLARGEGACP